LSKLGNSFNKKFKTTWKVDWINKCDYDLTLINTNYPDLKESMKNINVLNYKVIGSTIDNKLYQSFKILGIKTIVLVEKF
jgi:hypothetical protein